MFIPLKSFKPFGLTIVLSLAVLQANAVCNAPSGNVVSNTVVANFQGLTGVQGTDITGSFWAIDAATAGFGVANNNGAYSSTLWVGPYLGTHYVAFTWADRGITGCIGIGLTPATRDSVVLINNRVNEGQATHAGTFIAARYGYDRFFGGYDADRIVNGAPGTGCTAATPNCYMKPVLIPLPGVCTSGCAGVTFDPVTGAGIVQVSFAQPDITGYHDDRALTLTTPLVTGYEIYQSNGAAPPLTSSAAAWGAPIATLANTDCVGGSCAKLVALGTPVLPGQAGYLAVRVVFDSGFKSDFVSGNSAPISGAAPADDGHSGSGQSGHNKGRIIQVEGASTGNLASVSPAADSPVTGSPVTNSVATPVGSVIQNNFVPSYPAMIRSRAIPAGIPASFRTALLTMTSNRPGLELRWTTTDESRINGFDILVSKYNDSGFVLVNQKQIPAEGAPTRYVQNISQRTLVGQAGTPPVYYLLLQVVMRDGSLHEVGPVAVSFPSAE